MDLVRRCIAHDRAAWDGFVSAYSDLIYSSIFTTLAASSRGFSREDADDIFADVFLSLVDRDFFLLRNFQWRCGLRTMLWSVTRRRVARFYRKKGIQAVSLQGHSYADESPGNDPPADKEVLSPSHRIESEERRALLESSMADLTHRDKLCLTLYYYDGLNYREIGQILGLEINHVGQVIFRAKKRLEKILGDRV